MSNKCIFTFFQVTADFRLKRLKNGSDGLNDSNDRNFRQFGVTKGCFVYENSTQNSKKW